MNNRNAKELLDRYQSGIATPEEIDLFEKWVMAGVMRDLDLSDEELKADLKAIRSKLPLRYEEELLQQIPFTDLPVVSIKRWYKAWAAAAALILMTGAGLFYYMNKPKSMPASAIVSDIAPGKQQATLILGNGERIGLHAAGKGIIAKQSGAEITNTADGELIYKASSMADKQAVTNTIETPRGGQYQVVLPDGTRVWLNAESSLKYPVTFSKAESRKVMLSGEAYFEVAKNRKQPFIVLTDKQQVKVLGTHFNINSYPDEANTKTTLLEGSVAVNLTGDKEQFKVLKPGQQAVVSSTSVQVRAVNAEDVIAWKNNLFSFTDTDLPMVMRQLARWYNVEVVYEGNISNLRFDGKIDKSLTLKEVLNGLTRKRVNYKIEGRRVTISPSSSNE